MKGVKGTKTVNEMIVLTGGVVPPADPVYLFSDDFETGDLSHTEGTFTWGAGEGHPTDIGWKPIVSDENPYSGTKSLKFRFYGSATDDASSEQNFNLGTYYTDMYIQFQLYIPDGNESYGGAPYVHRILSGDNNKFLRIWDSVNPANGEQLGISLENEDVDPGGIAETLIKWNDPNVGPVEAKNELDNIIKDTDLGTWLKIKLRTKMATGADLHDGRIEVWKNDVLIHSETDVDNYHPGASHQINQGYLMGWANSGFLNDTWIFMDEIIFSENDI